MKNNLNEAFFWKNLADTLLDYSKLNKELFYRKLEPIKSVWDIQDVEKLSRDIEKAAKNKTRFIKESFSKIIFEIDNN